MVKRTNESKECKLTAEEVDRDVAAQMAKFAEQDEHVKRTPVLRAIDALWILQDQLKAWHRESGRQEEIGAARALTPIMMALANGDASALAKLVKEAAKYTEGFRLNEKTAIHTLADRYDARGGLSKANGRVTLSSARRTNLSLPSRKEFLRELVGHAEFARMLGRGWPAAMALDKPAAVTARQAIVKNVLSHWPILGIRRQRPSPSDMEKAFRAEGARTLKLGQRRPVYFEPERVVRSILFATLLAAGMTPTNARAKVRDWVAESRK